MKSDYIDYLGAVRRYSPRTCKIYSDILDEFLSFSGCGDDNELETYLNVQTIRSYEVFLM